MNKLPPGPRSSPKPADVKSATAGPAADKPAAKHGAQPEKPTGRVQFDERGNAVWEWSVSTGAFGRDVSTSRLKKLEVPGLSLADDPLAHALEEPVAAVKGYNPYDTGKPNKPTPAGRETPRKKP
jgi:hypothetical protein